MGAGFGAGARFTIVGLKEDAAADGIAEGLFCA
jgi:hypothetical protein